MLNTVHRNDLFNQTTLSKCGRVLRRKGVLTCYLNGTMREGGRRSGADLRHRCTTCMQGKCSLHAACCTFLSPPQANERCFWFQGTTNFYNTWYFPFAVTNWFTWKKLSHTACAYVNRYFLFTDSIESKSGAFPVFQWKATETFLVKASISDSSVIKRFWYNLEAKKAIKI